MDMSLGGLQELVMDREAWRSWGHKESDTTEQLNGMTIKSLLKVTKNWSLKQPL